MAHRLHVADVQLRLKATACQTADARVLPRYPVAESVLLHRARDLPPHLVVAPAGDHVVAVAAVHPRNLTAVLLSLLRPDRAREIARLVYRRLRGVQTARAKDLPAVPTAGLSHQDELVRRAHRLQTAKAVCVLRLPRALPLLPVVAARQAYLSHAQPVVTANRLTRAPVLHPGPYHRLCRAIPACPPDRDLLPLDLSLEPVPGCPPRARQRELAAEHSLDFRL